MAFDPTRPEATKPIPDEGLEAINRLWTLSRAFSNVAHDLNNALQVISGNAELLDAPDVEPAVRRRVDAIRSEAARAATVLNQFLTYARSTPADLGSIDVAELVGTAVVLRAASARRLRINISTE